MGSKGLSIALEKTEAVVLIERKKVRRVTFQVMNRMITTVESISYFGVTSLVEKIQCKAAKITADLNRSMSNMENPRWRKRRLLVAAHGTSLGSSVLSHGIHRKLL